MSFPGARRALSGPARRTSAEKQCLLSRQARSVLLQTTAPIRDQYGSPPAREAGRHFAFFTRDLLLYDHPSVSSCALTELAPMRCGRRCERRSIERKRSSIRASSGLRQVATASLYFPLSTRRKMAHYSENG